MQALERLPAGPFNAVSPRWCRAKELVQESIESLIIHFHLMTEGFNVPRGEAYCSVESSKGELGFYIVSDGSNKPYG